MLENRRDYVAMFKNLDLNEEQRDYVNGVIADVRKIAKRSDRIIWMLRFLKCQMILKSQMVRGQESLNYARKHNLFGGPLSEYSSYSEFIGGSTAMMTGFVRRMEHYFALPIPEIQNYVFDKQGINEVVRDFRDIEENWKKETTSVFDYDANDGTIIENCGDDWFWVMLDRAACTKEAEAMGHCGNSGRAHTQDRLISLRRLIKRGDKPMWRPSLTFILNEHGMLTEMKGRGNDKPSPKYHEQIIQLLLNDLVKGIDGGGFLPENNFAMSDLSPERMKEVIDLKPVLGTSYDMYQRQGVTAELPQVIYADFKRAFSFALQYGYFNPPDGEIEGDKLVVQHGNALASIIRAGRIRSSISGVMEKIDNALEVTMCKSPDANINYWGFMFGNSAQMHRFMHNAKIADDLFDHFNLEAPTSLNDVQGYRMRTAAMQYFWLQCSEHFIAARMEFLDEMREKIIKMVDQLLDLVVKSSTYYESWTKELRIPDSPRPYYNYTIYANLEKVLQTLDEAVKTPDDCPYRDDFEKEIISRVTWPQSHSTSPLLVEIEDLRVQYDRLMAQVVRAELVKLPRDIELNVEDLLRDM